ncbi:hypothetical protein MtrunA17_Chr5g0445171 [Medicago truncatula]|uniref:Transmembrane protein n=1 Tax=Medicago truncatula TaxID=3880 RepID=A0A396HWZ3_MEDTR|nr:hypothetical protein MtrunA17_Chr5g0445171 [Medicago truncatula]
MVLNYPPEDYIYALDRMQKISTLMAMGPTTYLFTLLLNTHAFSPIVIFSILSSICLFFAAILAFTLKKNVLLFQNQVDSTTRFGMLICALALVYGIFFFFFANYHFIPFFLLHHLKTYQLILIDIFFLIIVLFLTHSVATFLHSYLWIVYGSPDT